MFEGFIASILTRLLGEYVEDSTFSAEKVKLGVWRGAETQIFLLCHRLLLQCVRYKLRGWSWFLR